MTLACELSRLRKSKDKVVILRYFMGAYLATWKDKAGEENDNKKEELVLKFIMFILMGIFLIVSFVIWISIVDGLT